MKVDLTVARWVYILEVLWLSFVPVFQQCDFAIGEGLPCWASGKASTMESGRPGFDPCFNHTYYAVAHKCNMRQLFAIPASYKNNMALAKPEGGSAETGWLSVSILWMGEIAS